MPRHLLHIGYPKAGTNFLKAWLSAHPEILHTYDGFAGSRNTWHVQEVAVESEAVRMLATSCEGFLTPRLTGKDLMDRRTYPPGFLRQQQERVCAYLRDVYPNAHVLILTRGFQSMMRSGYSQYVRVGGTLSFAECMADPAPLAELLDYSAVVQMYEEAFGAEQVTVLPYELLRDDAQVFVRALEEVSGVGPFPFDPGRLNPSLNPRVLKAFRTTSRRVARVMRVLGERHAWKAYSLYAYLLMRSRAVRVAARFTAGPLGPEESYALPEGFLSAFAGRADALSARPFFARYAADYLLTGAEANLERRDSGPARWAVSL